MDRIPMWTRKKNSLEDVRRFLDYLGNPDRDRPAIHVAGTNGKGSVCAFLTSILGEAGYSTGTFISPHLVEVRERFLINGEMVDQESFEGAFETVLKASRKLADQGLCHPTFFEFLFYMAMVLFRMHDVDVMILETGMGGRLDTTNVLERPAACVITSIPGIWAIPWPRLQGKRPALLRLVFRLFLTTGSRRSPPYWRDLLSARVLPDIRWAGMIFMWRR